MERIGLEPGTQIGGYTIVNPLGAGAMGVVYRAVDGGGTPVAFKLLRTDQLAKDELRQRVAREAASLRKVKHPAVAAMLDVEMDEDEMFIVYELIDGPTLDSYVADHGPLRSQELHETAERLYDALNAVHEAGVIHRDMKPNNIIMSHDGPVLIDFGLAHGLEDHRLTRTGLVMGTPGYLAPELVNGHSPSANSDLWGWGAVLAFAATGRLPFGEGSFQSVIARAMAGKADVNGLDKRIAWALRGALAVSPEHRWAPDEVLDELESAATTPPDEYFTEPDPDVNATEVLDQQQLAAFAAGPTGFTQPAPRRGSASSATSPMGTDETQIIGPGDNGGNTQILSPQEYGEATEVMDAYQTNDGGTRTFTTPFPVQETANEPQHPSYPPPSHQPQPWPDAGQRTEVIPQTPAPQADPYAPPPPSFAPSSDSPPSAPGQGFPQAYGTNDAPFAPPPQPEMYNRPRLAPRPGVTIAISLAFLAWGVINPGWTAVIWILALIVMRTAGVCWDSFHARREARGATRHEKAVLIGKSPILVLRSLLGLIPNLAVALSCVLVFGGGLWWFIDTAMIVVGSGGEQPQWVYQAVIAVAVAIALAMSWWGPVSRLTRQGQREILKALIPQQFGTVVFVLIALTIIGFAAIVMASGAGIDWAPLPEPPSFG
ncbi:serine/threonine-protein kinase [Jonesia quinghaiensis]|uniref:serine/threonine-protein kinase n=1 Tax=Jonesia quinghaiensis TaxID=262806 RepID=UPI0003FB9389|nr:serine/threonine-protein kinase [Jonesia quinghaiensis]